MIKDSRSYEVQIIDAVRSVNRALGGTYGTSSAINKTEFNQYEVQLIDAIKGIGRTISGKGLSIGGGGAADVSGTYVTLSTQQTISGAKTFTKQMTAANIVPGGTNTLGVSGSRWGKIWADDADLSGDLSLASTSHIDIGPLRIEYDATNKALHITKKSNSDTNNYGIYADGFVSAGGIQ